MPSDLPESVSNPGRHVAVKGCGILRQVVLIFLPWLPINILDAFSVLVAVDVAGALLRWRTFDHLGHLGGELHPVSVTHP